ncbi:MAG: hypothetical protein HY038_00250 [Nitrospirae bacterium]|nr:hypothetical protein [Nitrospirota bacterium]
MKIQLWLEGEESFVDIGLAEVSLVHTPWIMVDVIRVSPNDQMRLNRFTRSIEEPAHFDHLLIRA